MASASKRPCGAPSEGEILRVLPASMLCEPPSGALLMRVKRRCIRLDCTRNVTCAAACAAAPQAKGEQGDAALSRGATAGGGGRVRKKEGSKRPAGSSSKRARTASPQREP